MDGVRELSRLGRQSSRPGLCAAKWTPGMGSNHAIHHQACRWLSYILLVVRFSPQFPQ
jgi:hypothetical protein